MDLIEMPSARPKSCADKRDYDRTERGVSSNVPDAKASNAHSDRSPKIANTEFGGPDGETLAPLARMIFVLEGMRSCANDKVLSALKAGSDEMAGDNQSSPAQSEAATGWAPGVMADIQSMFECDWTPEPNRRESAKLFGTTIIPVNDTGSSADHSETRRN